MKTTVRFRNNFSKSEKEEIALRILCSMQRQRQLGFLREKNIYRRTLIYEKLNTRQRFLSEIPSNERESNNITRDTYFQYETNRILKNTREATKMILEQVEFEEIVNYVGNFIISSFSRLLFTLNIRHFSIEVKDTNE